MYSCHRHQLAYSLEQLLCVLCSKRSGSPASEQHLKLAMLAERGGAGKASDTVSRQATPSTSCTSRPCAPECCSNPEGGHSVQEEAVAGSPDDQAVGMLCFLLFVSHRNCALHEDHVHTSRSTRVLALSNIDIEFHSTLQKYHQQHLCCRLTAEEKVQIRACCKVANIRASGFGCWHLILMPCVTNLDFPCTAVNFCHA